ncbi:hypothetical protein ACIQI8_17140 [Streptomyces sp. NPDC092369]|uniref:hypothetical protein n=1 Tax=Streptomyces sp. NPDC092369 TaxID=3366015 RepID=UPI00380E7781
MRPPLEDEPLDEELSVEDEPLLDELSVDELSVEEPPLDEPLDVDESVVPLPLSLLVVVFVEDALVSVSIVPMSANIPAAAARVTAAAVAAVRRAPLRTAAAAPRSLLFMAVPLPGDSVSLTTVGERPERSL